MASKRAKRSASAAKAVRRAEREEQSFIDSQVERAAQAHGDYKSIEIPDETKVVQGGKEKVTSTKVARNRGGTAVERWAGRGDLDERQIEAVALYSRAWHRVFQEQRVVMNWSMTASFRGGALGFEAFADSQEKAQRLLDLIDNEVFFHLPLRLFHVWQNVVLFDEAAGVAGSRLGYSNKQAEAAAKVAVTMVADMIANLMNLGAPRRPEDWLKSA